MAKYLNPKADLTFKKVFGEHKNLVISLLNSLLPLPEGMRIESVEYLSGENHHGTSDKKYSIVDVKCVDNYGRTFVVEMQNYWTTAFFSRTLYNAVLTYSNQLKKGQSFDKLKDVYALSLVNESEIECSVENADDYIHEYYLTNQKNSKDVHKDISLIFVELQKYKTLGKPFVNKAVGKIADLWMKFLTEIDDDTVEVDPELLSSPETAEALEILETSGYTPEELEAYNKYWLDISTERSALAEHEAKGRAEGLAQGLTQGAKHKSIETANKMKADNLPLEMIMKYTGFSAEEIAEIE